MKKLYLLTFVFLFLFCTTTKKQVKSDLVEQWMGVYLKNQKIGYSFSQIRIMQNDYKITNRFKIKLAMMDNFEEIISNFSGVTDTIFALRQFEFSLSSKKNSFFAAGEIKQNQFLIEVKSGGSIKNVSYEVHEPIYPVTILGELVIKKQFIPGREYTVKVFDATVLSIVNAKIKVFDKEKIQIGEKSYNLTKMTISMLGLTTTMWVDNNGISRKEESPPGMTIIEESREQALVQEEAMGKLDILSMFSIPIDTVIVNTRTAKYLKVYITGSDFSGFNITDNYQTILQINPLFLEIKIPDSLPQINLPIIGNEEYLSSTLCIQSDNAEIMKTASKIIGQEKDGAKIVQKIMNWVFTNINKRATASLPSALDVLKNREGDCNEHAVLFAALSRAAKIPCQICVGLVYVDGRFYYHAWNKVFFGTWIPVDPTFGQFPVDATHIKFAEGELEEQAIVLKIVGEIKIKVLEFR